MPQAGHADYSAQWVEFYRNMGMNREAEAVEQARFKLCSWLLDICPALHNRGGSAVDGVTYPGCVFECLNFL